MALAEHVPGLEINRSRGGLNFTVRGVATTDTSEKGDSSTAFLMDGIYIARAPMRDATFFDISRVEVLRGPQGTLYGRNTTAGVISVISNSPTFDFGGSVDSAIANYNSYQLTGALNVPVNESIALRGAVDYERNGSFLNAGPSVDSSYKKAREVFAGRLSALFKWDSGSLVIRGDYADISGANFYSLPLSNFFAPGPAVGAVPQYLGHGKSASELLALNVTIPFPMYRHNDSWGVSADLTQELGPVTLYYLGAYRSMHRDEQFANLLSNGVNGARQQTQEKDWQQSQELRLALNSVDGLKLQVGAYWFQESSHVIQRANIGINTTPTGENGTNLYFNIAPSAAESYAFFGQGTYSLTSALRITGGIRYTRDTKSRRGYGNIPCINSFFACTAAPGTPETENSNFASSKITWKVGVDYDLGARTLLYATVATGYKAGGFNNGCAVGTGPGCAVAPSTLYFNPESLTSYEAGVKARLLDNAFTVNLSAFHYDYSQLQLTQALTPCPSTPNIPSSTCTFTRNAAKAKIDGAEMESTIRPSRFDRFDVSVAYLHARYTDFQIRPTLNLAGRPLNRAPRWAVTAGYEHIFALPDDYEIVAGARTRVSDSYNILYEGGANFYRQPSFTQTDLTLTLNAPGKRWYVQGFAKNLENRIVINDVSSGSFQQVSVSEPRTYGARAGLKF
jgi:iron complex outermembrane receptor protein